jgi:hypothetical protein
MNHEQISESSALQPDPTDNTVIAYTEAHADMIPTIVHHADQHYLWCFEALRDWKS